MIVSNDWILKQIEMMRTVLDTMATSGGKKNKEEKLPSTQQEATTLQYALHLLLQDKRINEAEDLLFENLDRSKTHMAIVAAHFYEELNQWTDQELEENNFSREEIAIGLKDVCDELGFDFVQ